MTIVRLRPILLLAILGCAERSEKPTASANVPADSSCDFVRVDAHPDPDQLLAEFVARDARGEFTESSDWFDGAVDCPGHEPGPDQATIVKGHQVRILARGADTVRAEVRWDRTGIRRGGGEEDADSGVVIDTLVAVRTSFGWRIASPALNPHVPAASPSQGP